MWEIGDEILTFSVQGRPQTQGSKIVREINGVHIPVEDNPDLSPWRRAVAVAAKTAWRKRYRRKIDSLLDRPLIMRTVFYLKRNKSDFSTAEGKACELRPSARPFPDVKPDLFKMQRAVEDALTDVIYVDDSRIVKIITEKMHGNPEGVWVGLYLAATKGSEPWGIPSITSMMKRWSKQNDGRSDK